MNSTERIARHVCARMGYLPDMECYGVPGHNFMPGPLGHQPIPAYRIKAWQLYEPLVREVLMQLRDAEAARAAVFNEQPDPNCTADSLWKAGIDALLGEPQVPEEVAMTFCAPPDEAYSRVDESWKTVRGLK